MTFTELASVPSDPLGPFTDQLRLAVAAYLARFKGSSRDHTESDLRCYLTWCAEHGLDPLAAKRHTAGVGALCCRCRPERDVSGLAYIEFMFYTMRMASPRCPASCRS